MCLAARQVDSLRGGHVFGVTMLNDRLYVLRERELDQTRFGLDVYSTVNSAWQLVQVLIVDGQDLRDIASCATHQCLYVCDFGAKSVKSAKSVKKLRSDGSKVSSWPVDEAPVGISVSPNKCNVLIASGESSKLLELDRESGRLVRSINLPEEVVSPRHAILLPDGHILVSHGEHDVHMVCDIRGDTVIRSFGNDVDSESFGNDVDSEMRKLSLPCQMAVDKDGFVFVADCWNDRVVLLSPSLELVREIRDLGDCPRRLYLDHFHRTKLRLFVGLDDKLTVIEL